MSETSSEAGATSGDTPDETDRRDAERRQAVADVEEELDARSDGEGLAAEAGSGEETGLSEG